MSPEQARGELERIDRRSDIYGLGGILYAMLTGQPPYLGDAPRVLAQVCAGRLQPPSARAPSRAIPRELDAVVLRAMAADPAERYPDVAAQRGDIEAYLAGRTLAAARYTAFQVLAKWVARHPAPCLALLASTLLVSLVTIGFGVRLDARRAQAEQATRAEQALRRQVEQRARAAREQALLARLRAEARDTLWPALPARLPALLAWRARAGTLRAPDLRAALAPLARDVARRIEAARRVQRRSAGEDWTACGIAPQSGLAPLGADPASGLQEFAHLLSGEIPRRGADGRLQRTDRTGLVLVLIPAGTLQMGAALGGFAPDPHARPDEGPVHPVPLERYLIGKHELTLGQWRRISGEQRPGPTGLPVRLVSWQSAREILRRVGLRLPTEAQWEWAARGGTRTTWWPSANILRLTGVANLADRALRRAHPGAAHEHWLDDGHAGPAPVGSFRANGYGLHDVVGNVREWCRDTPRPYRGTPDPAARWYRVQRGASYLDLAVEGRSACRHRAAAPAASPTTGLRPSWPVSGR